MLHHIGYNSFFLHTISWHSYLVLLLLFVKSKALKTSGIAKSKTWLIICIDVTVTQTIAWLKKQKTKNSLTKK